MPYFKTNDTNLLFIHIPKTGGTSLENYFSAKYEVGLDTNALFGNLDGPMVAKNIAIQSTLQHITYQQIVQYKEAFQIDFQNLRILAVVRNPYERIISGLRYHALINNSTTKEETYNVITTFLESTKYDNHNLPQHFFLTDENQTLIPTIIILKTETLTACMHEIGYTDFNRVDNKNPHGVNCFDYLNTKSIELINDFYHLDFTLFKYDKVFFSE